MSKKNVLVLFSYRSHKHGYIEMLFDKLFRKSAEFGLELHRGSLSDMHIRVINNRLSVRESMTKKKLDEFDLVYFELWYKAQQQALAAARYLGRKKVPFFSHEIENIMPLTKVGELGVLADNGVPLPDTFISSHRELKKVFAKTNPPFGYPFILKAADGYGGNNNHLIRSYKQLVDILSQNKGVQYVSQEFIPNDCDYRCLVMGGEIKLVLKRTRDASSDSHLNNTSAGAEGKVVDVSVLDEVAQEAVLKSAQVLGRSQFAGVDLMLHKETGAPYILEVNQTPQIEIGAEVEKKMKALLSYMESLT